MDDKAKILISGINRCTLEKAALYRKKAQARYPYFVAGPSDRVCLMGHFSLVKEDRVEVENAHLHFPLEKQKKYTVTILTSTLFFCSSTI